MPRVTPRVLPGGPTPRGGSWGEPALKCLARFQFADQERQPSSDDTLPLHIGIMIHAGCAQWHIRRMYEQIGEDPNEWAAPLDVVDMEADTYGRLGTKAHSRARAAVEAFMWHRAADRLDIIAVEHYAELWVDGAGRFVEEPPDAIKVRELVAKRPFVPQRKPPYLHTLRLDVVYQDTRGRYWVEDLKSCQVINEKKKRGFSTSLQIMLMETWGRRAYGREFGGAWVHLVKTIPRFTQERLEPEFRDRALDSCGLAIVEREERLARAFDRYGPPSNPSVIWPPTYSEQGPCEDRYAENGCPYRDMCLRW